MKARLINISNESQLKNPDISGAIFTLSLSILNSQCVEGAKYVGIQPNHGLF